MKRAPSIAIASSLVALSLAWSGRARATQDFPGVVVQTLGLPGVTIDAPQGCRLCHSTDAGGTSLRPFGQLMQQYGAQPYQEGSVKGALAAIEQMEPQLVEDIKSGRDPNDDVGATNVHTPEYGCAIGTRANRDGGARFAWAGSAIAIASLVRRRRARTRRSARGSA